MVFQFKLKHAQYPFGYVNANEIDLQYQYRYANQVGLTLLPNLLGSGAEMVCPPVPQSNPTSRWRPYQPQTPRHPPHPSQRSRRGFPHCRRSDSRSHQGSDLRLSHMAKTSFGPKNNHSLFESLVVLQLGSSGIELTISLISLILGFFPHGQCPSFLSLSHSNSHVINPHAYSSGVSNLSRPPEFYSEPRRLHQSES